VAALDQFFGNCKTANIHVLASLAYAPAWANGGYSANGYAPLPAFNTAYADFCEWFLRRYATATLTNSDGRHTLDAIEIWNEPDLCSQFFKFGSPNQWNNESPVAAVTYANLVKVAGARLKTVRGQIGANDVLVGAPVISSPHGAAWAPTGQQSWMDGFYSVSGVTANYDFFSWHSYWESAGTTGWLPPELPPCWYPADQKQAVLGRLIAANDIWAKMTAAGDNTKPNWCTEIGGAARSGTAQHNPGRLLSFTEQKTHLLDAAAVLSAGNVTNLARIYWYELFDEPSASNEQQVYGLVALNATNPIAYSGAIPLNAATLTNKPAYASYKALTKSGGGVMFADNFDSGLAPGWWTVDTAGTWAASGGMLVCPHNGAIATAFAGYSTWSNYRVSCAIKFSDPWKTAGLLAGYNPDTKKGYYLRIMVDGGRLSHSLELFYANPAGDVQLASASIQGAYDFSVLRDMDLSIKDEGSGVRVSGYVNGVQYINYYDSSNTYRAGKVGVRSAAWSGTVSVDDFMVTPE